MSGGDGLRGRVLVIDGGSGRAARRFPPRDGRPAPGLTRILAAIAPQVLLAADGVDSVLLPSAVDADSIRDHLRAAARHPGPLLIHIGGHLVRDRRTGSLSVELDQDRLPWRTLEEELRLRPMQYGTLVIGDLSADPDALPQLRVLPSPLGAGLPLWASVSPDPQQVGTFTRALVEALHGGRPGAGERLTPEQLQQQVHTVLRPETQIVISHAPGWQLFRNTSRRLGPTLVDASLQASADQTAQLPVVGATVPQQAPIPTTATPPMPMPVSVPTPAVTQRSPETVTVELPMPPAMFAAAPPHHDLPADVTPFDMPPLPQHAPTIHLDPTPAQPARDDLAPYRDAIGAIVAAAETGEHARAVRESIALERSAVIEHGTDSEPVLKLRQVRAHVTRLAGLQREAALLYRDVALSLLDSRGADDPETRQAAANAEACWRAIEEDSDARRLGPDILRLRQALPDPRRTAAVQRHLARLRGEPLPSPTPPPEDAIPQDAAPADAEPKDAPALDAAPQDAAPQDAPPPSATPAAAREPEADPADPAPVDPAAADASPAAGSTATATAPGNPPAQAAAPAVPLVEDAARDGSPAEGAAPAARAPEDDASAGSVAGAAAPDAAAAGNSPAEAAAPAVPLVEDAARDGSPAEGAAPAARAPEDDASAGSVTGAAAPEAAAARNSAAEAAAPAARAPEDDEPAGSVTGAGAPEAAVAGNWAAGAAATVGPAVGVVAPDDSVAHEAAAFAAAASQDSAPDGSPAEGEAPADPAVADTAAGVAVPEDSVAGDFALTDPTTAEAAPEDAPPTAAEPDEDGEEEAAPEDALEASLSAIDRHLARMRSDAGEDPGEEPEDKTPAGQHS